jgi:tetratricopeptide (TPR) repeat protein
MLNGFSKNRHLIIVICLAIGLMGFLATRPKFVVKGKDKSVQQNQTQASSKDESHKVSITQETKEQIQILQKEVQKASGTADRIKTFRQISSLFLKESVFDSAGVYLEKIANLEPNPFNWTNAADAYFQAYNLALDESSISFAVEKTRQCYNKVLEKEAGNLHAKTNMAMTFVRTDSPMKAIGMLREVLDQDPNYVPALMSLGGLSMQSNQFDKAMMRFQNVLKIDPRNINAKIGLSYSLIELNKKEEAKVLLKQILEQDLDKVMKDELTKTLNSLK